MSSKGLVERLSLPALSVALFVGIFALRFALHDPNEVVLVLCVVPIALVALERGMSWGLAAAAFS